MQFLIDWHVAQQLAALSVSVTPWFGNLGKTKPPVHLNVTGPSASSTTQPAGMGGGGGGGGDGGEGPPALTTSLVCGYGGCMWGQLLSHAGHCGLCGTAQDPAAEQSTHSVAMSHVLYQAQLWSKLLHEA